MDVEQGDRGEDDDDVDDGNDGGSGMVFGTGSSTGLDGSASTTTLGPGDVDSTTTNDTPQPFCDQTDCNDDDPCTVDTCDPDTETCVHELSPGAACDDANACTTDDTCQPDGTCAGTGLCTVEHCGEIAEDEVWGPDVVHLVTCAVFVRGPDSPTLTILDGARVEVEPGQAFIVGHIEPGRLDVQGGALGVVFTSSAAAPLPGDWVGFEFARFDAGSTVTGALVEYAGISPFGAITLGGVFGDFTEVQILDSEVRHGAGGGIYVGPYASATIQGCTIADNAGDGLYVDWQAQLSDAFSGNVVTGNGGAAVRIDASEIAKLDASSTYAGNGEPVVGGGFVGESSTWQRLDVPYHLSVLYVEGPWNGEPATLELEPGITLVVDNTIHVGLGVDEDGALLAVGTEDDPIRLEGAELRFNSGSVVAPSILEHVIFEGGQGIVVNEGNITIAHSVIRDNTMSPALRTSTYGFELSVTDTTFEDNATTAVDACGPLVAFTGNTIVGNAGVAMRVHPNVPGVMDSNVIAGNGLDVVELLHMELTADTSWPALTVPYRFTDDEVLRALSPGATLTVEAGAILEFDAGASLAVGGVNPFFDYDLPAGLVLAGAPDAPVVLRSAEASPSPGDWGGVRFAPQALPSQLDQCVIQHAGSGSGAVVVEVEGVTVSNCTIADSASYGIYQDGVTATLVGNTYIGNADGDVFP